MDCQAFPFASHINVVIIINFFFSEIASMLIKKINFSCYSFSVGLFKSVTAARIQVFLALISNGLSLYLAYLLYFVLEDFCVVCVSTYIVNIAIIILAINRYEVISREANNSPKKSDAAANTKKTK